MEGKQGIRSAKQLLELAVFRIARHVIVRPIEKRLTLVLLKRTPSLKRWTRTIFVGKNATAAQADEASREKNLFVDASRLSGKDGKSGIPRVTRSVLCSLMKESPEGLNVVPVFATRKRPGYFELRGHGLPFEKENVPVANAKEELVPIRFGRGDVFLCLDYHPLLMIIQRYYLAEIQKEGVKVYSIVHDLLPVHMPEKFPPRLKENHENWLRAILRFSGALCISSTVAEDLKQWILEEAPGRFADFSIGWFHLGADFENFPSLNESETGQLNFQDNFPDQPYILMVGTVEGRKGYSQALEAFETLWGEGGKISLFIAGKEGWLVQDLCKRIRSHAELGKRLFWFEDLNDRQLFGLYQKCTALLMASEGEGFGLPLVEAARLGAPLIARDLPVIREVTGGHAFFFKGDTPEELADPLKEWLALQHEGMQPGPGGVPWLTWAQSSRNLAKAILDLQPW